MNSPHQDHVEQELVAVVRAAVVRAVVAAAVVRAVVAAAVVRVAVAAVVRAAVAAVVRAVAVVAASLSVPPLGATSEQVPKEGKQIMCGSTESQSLDTWLALCSGP
jgi:uncharacterized membrane protein